MCQRGTAHLATLKSKQYISVFLKTLQRLKQEWQKSPASGPGKQTTKTWFGLVKQKENEPNYQCLLLLTVLPLNYFMNRLRITAYPLLPCILTENNSDVVKPAMVKYPGLKFRTNLYAKDVEKS